MPTIIQNSRRPSEATEKMLDPEKRAFKANIRHDSDTVKAQKSDVNRR